MKKTNGCRKRADTSWKLVIPAVEWTGQSVVDRDNTPVSRMSIDLSHLTAFSEKSLNYYACQRIPRVYASTLARLSPLCVRLLTPSFSLCASMFNAFHFMSSQAVKLGSPLIQYDPISAWFYLARSYFWVRAPSCTQAERSGSPDIFTGTQINPTLC